MLKEKDYCDYETCVALKELGYKIPTSAYYMPNHEQLIFVSNPFRGGIVIDCFRSHNSYGENVMGSEFIDGPTLWEAQKWLREEKGIIVGIINNFTTKEFDYYISTWDKDRCTGNKYTSYENALLRGIKEAVKILKEDETISWQRPNRQTHRIGVSEAKAKLLSEWSDLDSMQW